MIVGKSRSEKFRLILFGVSLMKLKLVSVDLLIMDDEVESI